MVVRVNIRADNRYVLVWEKKDARQTFRRAGAELLGASRKKIARGKGGGRTYYLTGGGKYQASAPGQPPASRSGVLRRSGKVFVFRSGTGFAVRYGGAGWYSNVLEHGARGGAGSRHGKASALRGTRKAPVGSRSMEARPFLSEAWEEQGRSIESRVQDAIIRGIEFRRSGAKAK